MAPPAAADAGTSPTSSASQASSGMPAASTASASAAAASRSSSEFRPAAIQELRDSKQELIIKVQNMKKELADWRGRINQQVELYRSDLTGLQASLTSEMAGLRGELADVKARIRAQLEANEATLGALRVAGAGDPATRAALAGAGTSGAASEPVAA